MAIRTPPSRCARCHTQLTGVSDLHGTDQMPPEGAVSLCFYCGNIGIFNADATVREPTPQERYEIRADVGVRRQFERIVAYWLAQTNGERFPCGCKAATSGEFLFFEPCSPTCDLYAYLVEQDRISGRPIETVRTGRPWLR